jgi:hypothetical protein
MSNKLHTFMNIHPTIDEKAFKTKDCIVSRENAALSEQAK